MLNYLVWIGFGSTLVPFAPRRCTDNVIEMPSRQPIVFQYKRFGMHHDVEFYFATFKTKSYADLWELPSQDIVQSGRSGESILMI